MQFNNSEVDVEEAKHTGGKMTKEDKEGYGDKTEDGDKDSGKGVSPTGSLKSNCSKKSSPEANGSKPNSASGTDSQDGSKENSQSSQKPREPPQPAVVGNGKNAVVVTDLEQGSPRPSIKLLVGPVIGHVTSCKANVLLEIDTDLENFEVVLKEIRYNGELCKKFTEAKDLKARSPTVFHFKHLPPKTTFNVVAPMISSKNIGMVRTLADKIERLNIAFVSCDRGIANGGYDHWSKLWKRVNADQLHIILHLGDQVYIDDYTGAGVTNEELVKKGWKDPEKKDVAYVKARNILNETPKKKWKSKQEEIRELYRDVYRKRWNNPNKRKILATMSNLMICDDHEFRDNFGSVSCDSDSDSAEHFLGLQALRVYHEYQRQLWDPDILTKGHQDLASEFYCLTFGSLGIMMSETRTKNSVYKCNNEGDDTYFGKKQYEGIKSAFNSNHEVKMWLFATAMPLLFVRKKISHIAGKVDIGIILYSSFIVQLIFIICI